jgi:hypothetical protein
MPRRSRNYKVSAALLEKIAGLVAQVLPTKYPELLADDFDGNITHFEELKSELEKIAGLPRIKQIRSLLAKGRELRTLAKLHDSLVELENESSDE